MGAQVWRPAIHHALAMMYSLLGMRAVHPLWMLQMGTLLRWVQI